MVLISYLVYYYYFFNYVVVVVNSHVQRIVLATEKTTVTQQDSHIIDLLMPTPLVVTKRYEGQWLTSWGQPATQTNRDPNRDKKSCNSTRNGTGQYQNGSSNLLTPYYREQPRSTPTHDQCSQQQTGRITLQPVLINKSKFLGFDQQIRRVSTDGLNHDDSQLTASLEGKPALHPPERPSHTHTPKPGFGGRGYEVFIWYGELN